MVPDVRSKNAASGHQCPIPLSFFSFDLEAYGLIELSSILACCLVSIRVGLKGAGINDSLVVHQLVTLVVGKGVDRTFWRLGRSGRF